MVMCLYFQICYQHGNQSYMTCPTPNITLPDYVKKETGTSDTMPHGNSKRARRDVHSDIPERVGATANYVSRQISKLRRLLDINRKGSLASHKPNSITSQLHDRKNHKFYEGKIHKLAAVKLLQTKSISKDSDDRIFRHKYCTHNNEMYEAA